MPPSRTSTSFGLLVAPLSVAAAAEALGGAFSPGLSSFIAMVAGEGLALLLAVAVSVPVLLVALRFTTPFRAASLAAWPTLFFPAYLAFHDVKYEVLGPYPGSLLENSARIAVLLGSLVGAIALVALSQRATRPMLVLSVLALALAPLMAYHQNRPGPAGEPSLLLVTIDTLRADHLGGYGHPLELTPHLDRLSRQGEIFENAFCQIPITTPSHASILTGLYPPLHAVRGQAYSMSRSVPTLTESLHDAGFSTAAFVAAYPLDSKFGLWRGFDLYDDEFTAPPGPRRLSLLRFLSLLGGAPQIERSASEVNQQAFAWLRQHGGSRYFAWVHYFDPHGPYTPAEPWRSLFLVLSRARLPAEPPPDEEAESALQGILSDSGLPTDELDFRIARLAYDAEIAATDYEVGRLLRMARARASSPPIITLLSDHGESLTEHGAYFRHGEDLYEPSLRIPLILVPGARRGINVDVTETVDLAPRLAHRVEIPWTSRESAEVAFAESTSAAVHYRPRKVVGVRTSRHKLVRGAEDGRVELYDLHQDPRELRDLSAARPDLTGPLEELLDGYQAAGTGERPPEDVDRETIEKLRALGYLQ